MARTLFFCMVLRKFSEITYNKPIFSQYNIFYNYEYFFLQSISFLLSFQSSPKQSIKLGTIQSVLQLALFSCFAVHSLRTVAMLFNIFRKLNEIAYTNLNYFFLLTYSRSQNSGSYQLLIILCLKGGSFLFLVC